MRSEWYWFVRCDLQIFSGCVCHLEQLHAQSPFLFPIVFSINTTSTAYFLDVHPTAQRDMEHIVWHHVVHLSVRQHLANPHCTPQSAKALDPRVSLWKHKERRVSVSTHWHMFISTNNSDRGDHYQTVAKHRTWAENGFSQQAIVIVGWFQILTSLSAVPSCKRPNNARKILNNAFLMLFFKIGI